MGIINKSRIKEITDLQVSEEFYLELEKLVVDLIKKAEKRAKENFRRTLFSRDL